MGDRYTFLKSCPNCGKEIGCYYASSSNCTEVKCSKCNKKYEIQLDFQLVEKED